MTYGLPTGTQITYGSKGFPDWVSQLAAAFNLKASTYPGHQESDRSEAGFAPNPQRLNRGIDWVGSIPDMQRFADYLLTIKGSLEQVIWANPHDNRKVGVAGGKDVTATPYYAGAWSGHTDHVHSRQSQPIPLPTEEPVANKPAYNEFPVWSKNHSARTTKVDAWLIHTQEGGGGDEAAEVLARWFRNGNNVSYHYVLSQASDGGVTVVDCVDTDHASWSVLSANGRSINLCFAGSRAGWSREQWLKQSKAIDVAAYLAVQDCKKYGIPTKVIAPPYKDRLPGISDHRYVTKVLGDGSHTDVGDQFPWGYFAERVTFWASGGADGPTPTPAPPKAKRFPDDWTDRELMIEVLRQLRGPTLAGWQQLDGKSLVDAVAELRRDA